VVKGSEVMIGAAQNEKELLARINELEKARSNDENEANRVLNEANIKIEGLEKKVKELEEMKEEEEWASLADEAEEDEREEVKAIVVERTPEQMRAKEHANILMDKYTPEQLEANERQAEVLRDIKNEQEQDKGVDEDDG
jgi:hypothetical protein